LESMGIERPADLHEDLLRHRFIRRLVGIEVTDVIATTSATLAAAEVTSLAALRALPHNAAGYSDEMERLNRELRQFLFQNFYRNYRVVRMAVKAERTLTSLFTAYVEQPNQLAPALLDKVQGDPEGLHRVVCDYLAGMTDRYAIQEYRRLFDMEERA
jgi:dGTPase